MQIIRSCYEIAPNFTLEYTLVLISVLFLFLTYRILTIDLTKFKLFEKKSLTSL